MTPSAPPPIAVATVDSCAHLDDRHRGQVVVAGSYGGYFNAFNAARRFVRALVLNDAGVGIGGAGIAALAHCDRIGLATAAADVATCFIGDGADMLARGVISHINAAAAALGCRPGHTVRECATLMTAATVPNDRLPPPPGAGRFLIEAGPCPILCADSLIMLEAEDRGRIVITGSHGALPHRKPDGLVAPDVAAIFLSDGGIGAAEAGVARLALLNERAIPAGAISVWSAPIGDARAMLATGALSRVNRTAAALGLRPGQRVRDAVALIGPIVPRSGSTRE